MSDTDWRRDAATMVLQIVRSRLYSVIVEIRPSKSTPWVEEWTDDDLASLAELNSRIGTLIWTLRNTHTERGSND